MIVREQILSALLARLAAVPGVAQAERMISGDPSSFPALILNDGDQTVLRDQAEPNVTRYAMRPSIEGYVETADGPAAAAQINELYGALIRALITEPPLDGLAETIDEIDVRFSVAQLASARRLGFLAEFEITFITRRGEPAQL